MYVKLTENFLFATTFRLTIKNNKLTNQTYAKTLFKLDLTTYPWFGIWISTKKLHF